MPRDRLVVVDTPGAPIIVTSYVATGERVEVAIRPGRALALAQDLIEAARRRLNERNHNE